MNSNESKSLRDLITNLFARGEFDEGMRRLQGAEGIPAPVELECLGNFLFYKRELQNSVEKYEKAISIDPGYMISRYQYLVGTQDEKRGDLVAAFKRYQAAIDIEPSFVDAYIELGGLLVKVEDFEGAAQCYRDALKISPDDIMIYFNLKSVLKKLVNDAPDKYREELAEVDKAYSILGMNGALLPKDSKW
jgi:tetratricopeptide (TPR) repeat protein